MGARCFDHRGCSPSCTGSRPDAVHVAYLARGHTRLQSTLLAVHDLLIASATPHRLCFHLLLDWISLRELDSDPHLLVRAGMHAAQGRHMFVVNATDAALREALGVEGQRWLNLSFPHSGVNSGRRRPTLPQQTAAWTELHWSHSPKFPFAPYPRPPYSPREEQQRYSRAQLYTAPKLFLYNLLQPFVEQCLVLDNDLLALGDACALADYATARFASARSAGLMYAREQMSHHERFLRAGLYGSKPPATDAALFGFNGGVAVHQLARLRQDSSYSQLLSAVREEVTALPEETRAAVKLDPVDDQTALTLAAGWREARTAALILPLPCEWNWQMSLWWYTMTSHAKPVHQADSTCYEPPRLLHANAYGKPVVRALHRRREVSTATHLRPGETVLSRKTIVDALSEHLMQRVQAGNCGRASISIPSIASRFCNATFLLQRLHERGARTTASIHHSASPAPTTILSMPQHAAGKVFSD
jgi:hypothetical protein